MVKLGKIDHHVDMIAYEEFRFAWVWLLVVKVMEVINSLEAHRKKAENEGNYMEARAAAQRLNGVKVKLYCKTEPSNSCNIRISYVANYNLKCRNTYRKFIQ